MHLEVSKRFAFPSGPLIQLHKWLLQSGFDSCIMAQIRSDCLGKGEIDCCSPPKLCLCIQLPVLSSSFSLSLSLSHSHSACNLISIWKVLTNEVYWLLLRGDNTYEAFCLSHFSWTSCTWVGVSWHSALLLFGDSWLSWKWRHVCLVYFVPLTNFQWVENSIYCRLDD